MTVTNLKKSVCAGVLLTAASTMCVADEGGVSFWLPGQYGSFAAVPGDPGWSLPLVYYHSSSDAGADRAFRRGGAITAGLDVTADLLFAIPTYVFSTPVAGGQASVGMAAAMGRVKKMERSACDIFSDCRRETSMYPPSTRPRTRGASG